MITLSRLNRTIVALNPDLIERVEENPDTVVTLTDGKKLLVIEGIDDIIEKIIAFRALVSARSAIVDIARLPPADLQLVGAADEVASVTTLDENGVR